MSRFDVECDEYDQLAQGRWEANVERAIKGKRGQKALREMRDALLAMPVHRLIADEFATPAGEVCAIGCAVAYKRAQAAGTTIPEAAVELAKEDPDPFDEWTLNAESGKYERQVERVRWTKDGMVGTGEFYTEDRWHDDDPADYTAGRGEKEAGFAYTLAWHIGWLNDEEWHHLTPEQRWTKCLAWVESKIAS